MNNRGGRTYLSIPPRKIAVTCGKSTTYGPFPEGGHAPAIPGRERESANAPAIYATGWQPHEPQADDGGRFQYTRGVVCIPLAGVPCRCRHHTAHLPTLRATRPTKLQAGRAWIFFEGANVSTIRIVYARAGTCAIGKSRLSPTYCNAHSYSRIEWHIREWPRQSFAVQTHRRK